MNERILRQVLRAASALSSALLVAGCVTEVDASSETRDVGVGGSGNVAANGGGSGGSAPCVPQPQDPNAAFQQPTCADLSVMVVSDPVVADDSGDGKVSPGESATITVKLSEVAGKGFGMYPGVTFSSALATIDDPGSAQLYAILACQVDELSTRITIPTTVAKGTVVQVKAQVSFLGAECPEAESITVAITIE